MITLEISEKQLTLLNQATEHYEQVMYHIARATVEDKDATKLTAEAAEYTDLRKVLEKAGK